MKLQKGIELIFLQQPFEHSYFESGIYSETLLAFAKPEKTIDFNGFEQWIFPGRNSKYIISEVELTLGELILI